MSCQKTFQILSALGVETCGDLLENGDRLLLVFGERSAEGYLRAAKGIGSSFGQGITLARRKLIFVLPSTTIRKTHTSNLSRVCVF